MEPPFAYTAPKASSPRLHLLQALGFHQGCILHTGQTVQEASLPPCQNYIESQSLLLKIKTVKSNQQHSFQSFRVIFINKNISYIPAHTSMFPKRAVDPMDTCPPTFFDDHPETLVCKVHLLRKLEWVAGSPLEPPTFIYSTRLA